MSEQQPSQRELLQIFLHSALFLITSFQQKMHGTIKKIQFSIVKPRCFLSKLTSPDLSDQALSIDVVFVSIRPYLHQFCRILFIIFVWGNFVTRPYFITQAKIHGILLRLRKKRVDAGWSTEFHENVGRKNVDGI